MEGYPFKNTEETHDGIPVIVIEGEVDIYTSPRLKDHIISLIEKGEANQIVTLAKVDYLDSSALSVLIGALKRLNEINGTIVLVSPTRKIHRVFEITGLDKIFDFYQSVEEAVGILASREPIPA